MAAQRRCMPWMAVEKDDRFEGPNGVARLLDLFEGRRQVIVERAFNAPEVTTYPRSGGPYPGRACVGCPFGADEVPHPATWEISVAEHFVMLAGVRKAIPRTECSVRSPR